MTQGGTTRGEDRTKERYRGFWSAFNIICGIVGLLNLNWWIALPGAVLTALAVTVWTNVGRRRSFKLGPLASRRFLLLISLPLLLFALGFIARGAINRYTSIKLPDLSIRTRSLVAIRDFDGDGKADVFRTKDGSWEVSYSGREPWKNVNGSVASIGTSSFDDFNGDGTADVYRSDPEGNWYVTFSTRDRSFWSSWTQLTTSNGSTLPVKELGVGTRLQTDRGAELTDTTAAGKVLDDMMASCCRHESARVRTPMREHCRRWHKRPAGSGTSS